MPTVPYNPVPEITSGPATPYRSDRGANETAFGAGIGASEEKLGTQVERLGDVLASHTLQMQNLKNEADVNVATTADLRASGELTNKFRQLPGNQAQEALNDHINNLQKSREEIRATLTNPMAQKMFDQQTMHRFALDVVNSSAYAATQLKQFTKQTNADLQDLTIQDTIRDRNTPGAIDRGIEKVRKLVIANGRLDGLDENNPGVTKEVRGKITTAFTHILSATADTDPERAQKMFDEVKGRLDQSRVPELQNKILDRGIQHYATLDAAEIADRLKTDPDKFVRNPEGTLVQMNAEAARKADERYPTDTLRREQYLTQTQNNIANIANRSMKAEKDREADIKATVTGIAGQRLPNGTMPSSIQDLMTLNPNAANWVDEAVRRDPNFRTRLTNIFAANNKEDNIVRPEVLSAQQSQWAGMTNDEKMKSDPAATFRAGQIDRKTMESWQKDQNNIKHAAVVDYNVDSILKRHGAALNDAGIFQSRTDKDANTRYLWIRGALSDELQRVQGASGTPVKGPQEDEIITKLLKQTLTGEKSWLGFPIISDDITAPKYETMTKDRPTWAPEDAVRRDDGQWHVWRNGKDLVAKPPERK